MDSELLKTFKSLFTIYNDNKNILLDFKENHLEELFEKEISNINKGIYLIFMKAIDYKASDIHFENFNNYLKIRFRINGILKEILKIDKDLSPLIFSKIKILASLDIVEKRRPQDGRFSLVYKKREIDFRTSFISTINGEKLVIRILDKNNMNLTINDLYMSEEDKILFLKAIGQNSGIILVNGPTGSGKSTTLYTILKYKNSEELNISTVEDPIEYQIEGINQSQCKNEIGLSFSTILKSLLRQDPDILMIGEIRDKETAEIAVKASLTGHLVFSTLHSNNTLGCINRLLNLEIDPYLLSIVLVMIISQRLVRKLCPNCKKVDTNFQKKLESLGIDLKTHKKTIFYTHSSNGCSNCMYTGYVGRLPIFEILFFDDSNKEKLLNKSKLNLKKNLLVDAIDKAQLGLTSLDEILRQI